MQTPSEEHSAKAFELSEQEAQQADFQMEPEQVADIPGFDQLDQEQLVQVGLIDEEAPKESAAEVAGGGALAIPLFREEAVQKAVKEKGYHEEPKGSNRNKYSKYFGKGDQPWCADFVSWAYDITGNRDKKVPWLNPSAVTAIAAWAGKTGNFVTSPLLPQRGDIFVIKNSKQSHVGLVVSVNAKAGTFTSIEGNTSGCGCTGTDCVCSHTRTIKTFKFVRVPSVI